MFLFFCNSIVCRAVFLLALIITIAVVVTRDSDDDEAADESTNNRPARVINPNEFFTLMATFDGPISGKFPSLKVIFADLISFHFNVNCICVFGLE